MENAAPVVADVPISADPTFVPGHTGHGPQVTPEPAPETPIGKEATAKHGIDASLQKAMAKATEAADKAKAEVDKTKSEPPKDAKADPKAEAPKNERQPDGKFAPREPKEPQLGPDAVKNLQQQRPDPNDHYRDPPQRFHETAKAEWANAPTAVRAEITRVLNENEKGFEKYRASHEMAESLKEYAERAKQSGTDLKTVMGNYVGMEDALRKNPVAGLETIMRNLNLRTSDGRTLTLHDVAAHIMGQTPDQRDAQSRSTISELQNEIQSLKNELSGVVNGFKQQQETAVYSKLEAFAETHPRILDADFQEDVAMFIETGRASNLKEAYSLAERLNPAPETLTPSPQTPLMPAAQTGDDARQPKAAAQKSITGSPSNADLQFTPQKKNGTKSSIDEALQKALRAVQR